MAKKLSKKKSTSTKKNDLEKNHTIGQAFNVLFWIGVVVCISAGAKLPAASATYPDTLGLFSLGILVTLAGLFGWRRSSKMEALILLADNSAGTAPSPITLLTQADKAVASWSAGLGRMSEQKILTEVGSVVQEMMVPFFDQRQLLVQAIGQEAAANVLSDVARAERTLNRMYTAASDGFPGEARRVYPEAKSSLHRGLSALKKSS